MNIIVRSKRILEKMKAFRPVLEGKVPDYLDNVISNKEPVVGVYENSIGAIEQCIVIKMDGMKVEENGKWIDISFSDIVNVQCPSDKKIEREYAGIYLILQDGRSIVIPVRGGSGRFLDVFEFGRFLLRVLEDVGREKASLK